MSALAMLLTAAMALPENGPEMVSGEIEQASLNLDGEWEGTITYEDHQSYEVTLARHDLTLLRSAVHLFESWKMKDEGDGRCKAIICGRDYLGNYCQEGDRVIICYRKGGKARPASFRAGDGQTLLILHRVKPRK